MIHEAFSIIPLTLLPPEKKSVVMMGQHRGSRGLLLAQSLRSLKQTEL